MILIPLTVLLATCVLWETISQFGETENSYVTGLSLLNESYLKGLVGYKKNLIATVWYFGREIHVCTNQIM